MVRMMTGMRARMRVLMTMEIATMMTVVKVAREHGGDVDEYGDDGACDNCEDGDGDE